MNKKYKIALKEVNDILKLSEFELQKRIPYKVRKFIVSNMDYEYKTNIQADISLEGQQISEEAKNILAYLYKEFLGKEDVG